jgi:hypothetical protein
MEALDLDLRSQVLELGKRGHNDQRVRNEVQARSCVLAGLLLCDVWGRHWEGTRLIVEFIEKFWCPTGLSEEILNS